MSAQPLKPKSLLREALPMECPKESALSRLIIAPLSFVTFLISLALIDSRNTSLRSSHPPSQLSRARDYICGIVYKPREGGPYDYVKNPAAKAERDNMIKKAVVEGKGGDRKGEHWHWHSKQRHMMKAEFEDAFRLRNSVAVGLIVFVLGVGWCVYSGLIWAWKRGWARGRL